MYIYKDYNYVKEVYENYELEEALSIYLKACEQETDEKLWDLYRIHITHSDKSITFDTFKKQQKQLSQSKNMTEIEQQKIQMKSKDLREAIRNKKGTVVNVSNLARR